MSTNRESPCVYIYMCVCVCTTMRVQCRTPTAVFGLQGTAVEQKLMLNLTVLCHIKPCIAVNRKGIFNYPT